MYPKKLSSLNNQLNIINIFQAFKTRLYFWDTLNQQFITTLVLFFSSASPSPPPSKPVIKEEPEKIRKWREEQKTRLEEKGTKSIINKSRLTIIIFRRQLQTPRKKRRRKNGVRSPRRNSKTGTNTTRNR